MIAQRLNKTKTLVTFLKMIKLYIHIRKEKQRKCNRLKPIKI